LARGKFVIIGAKEAADALEDVAKNLDDISTVLDELMSGMRKYVHIQTGYLRDSIYKKKDHAGASAPYAGYEADRGGEHDFAQRAIDAFNLEKYADHAVEPF